MLKQTAREENMIARLKDEGYHITPQRVAIVRALANNHEHPSVDQIYTQVKADFPMTSLATIYKTITLLKEMGEVLEISLGDGTNHYDGAIPEPHPHLICVQCQRIEDLVGPAVELPIQKVEHNGYQILSYRLDFFGLCPQCQKSRTN